jgi:hypothetical protein
MDTVRKETDSLGVVEVSEDKLWGRSDSAIARTLQHRHGSDSARDDRGVCHFEKNRLHAREDSVGWTGRLSESAA